ncbi:MAG: hypothetical protein H6708_09785 [Kofleriaceae bacterium]|nr:hypothetical protein [Myxococcales bacterium]MCB9560686.1 hypothetical protein [Kofleriaceae bacterium]
MAAPLPTDAPTRTERYGVQILAADVALFATLAVAAKAEVDDSVGSLIALGYFATGPLIHLKHGNTRGAVRSMAARALLPMGGALVGMVLASNNRCDGDLCGLEVVGGMAIGGAVGMASAMVLDWTVLGKTEVEAPVVGRVVISPRVDVSRRGVSVGVGGAF